MVLGIDIGGTAIKSAMVDTADGTVTAQWTCPTVPAKEALLQQLSGIISSAVAKYDPSAIGIATPGVVDTTRGVVAAGAPNIEGWTNVRLAELIGNETGLPVSICNDGDAMGFGELRYGAADGFKDVVFVSVGTGIGGAVILQGKLLSGRGGRGGEIGCIPFMAGGRRCSCGASGCWEEYASTSAMVRAYREKTGLQADGRRIVELYRQGDPAAVEVFHLECEYLGRGIAGLINIFAPEVVVVGGGISESGPEFIEKVSDAAFASALTACSDGTRITAARLGNLAGVVGAAAFASDKFCETKHKE